jgi:hypothetical protein
MEEPVATLRWGLPLILHCVLILIDIARSVEVKHVLVICFSRSRTGHTVGEIQ